MTNELSRSDLFLRVWERSSQGPKAGGWNHTPCLLLAFFPLFLTPRQSHFFKLHSPKLKHQEAHK